MPFQCDPTFYQFAGSPSNVYEINLVTGEVTLITTLAIELNAIGYNPIDNLIYGVRSNGEVYTVESDFSTTLLPTPIGLPAEPFNSGTFDENGYYYILRSNQTVLYVIDYNPGSPTFGKLVDPTNGYSEQLGPTYGVPIATPGGSALGTADIAWDVVTGNLYGAISIGGSGVIRCIDVINGIATDLPTTGVPSAQYGAAGSFIDGEMYFPTNNTFQVIKVTTDGVTATGEVFSNTPVTFSVNDGTTCINARLEIDFGDAPDTDTSTQGTGNYRTLLASDGPRHGIVNTLTLGTQVTSESDAYQNATATGDDISQGIQDDGPTFPITNIALNATDYTLSVDVLNDTGVTANVYAWIDFNKDGIFQTDEGFTTTVLSNPLPQNIDLDFTVPGVTTLTAGSTFARVRVTTDTLTNTGGATGEDTRSFGPASDGEVEDYEITIEDTMINSVKSVNPAFADLGDVITYTVELTNPGTLPISDVFFQDSPPSGTIYNNNLSVSTAFTGIDPDSGLTITNINPGEIVTISWEVLVDNAIPTPNPIENTGNITIPNLPPTTTNTVETQINTATITPQKTADKAFADIGDEIFQTITFTNTGNVDAENIVITDPIPNGTSLVPGSLNINVPYTGDLSSGIVLTNPLAPGETVIISYRLLVEDIPNPNPIQNTATVDYEYTVDPVNPPVTQTVDSNTTTTEVNNATLTPQKTTDREYADIGDEIFNTITFTNTGNVDAENVVITDPIPNGTSLVPGSLSVNVPYTGDLDNGIALTNPVAPSEGIIITYRLLVESIPNPNPIPNTATVDYEYTVDPAEPPVTQTTNSNTTTTEVNHAQIDPPVKTGDPSDIVQVGDTIDYSITFTNTGNVDAENVVITDPIRNGTSLVPGSLSVNVPFIGNLNSGIVLTNPVGPGETIVIDYTLLVEEIPNPNPIENTATVDYGYRVDPNEPLVTESVDSNTVSILVNPVSIVKTCTPSKAALTETITYHFTITNTSAVDITNVTFFDILPSGVTFVDGSFVGSTNPNVKAINLVNGVPLGTIAAGETASPSFQVTVTNIPCPQEFPNIATITYNAEFQTGVTSTVTSTSNTCTVEYRTLSFLQCFKDGILEIPSQKPDIESLISVDVNLLFQDYEVIDSPVGTSNSKQNLTGKKLLVHFKLCIIVTYIAADSEQSVHSAEYELGKCEYIVLPNIDDYNCLISLTYEVEDIFYSQLNNRNVFYNITYIIESGI
ncbi:DUF7507 domain-containing protein [Clostridium sp. B9]|uniref:DUF7507 domain-containing protein n=1 Tax=Clostridium sp. B9 TaxID=3423224 RepID=UPI003D2F3248